MARATRLPFGGVTLGLALLAAFEAAGQGPSTVEAVGKRVAIEGRVTDPAGRPVPSASVWLIVTGSAPALTVTSDRDGRFRFEDGPGARAEVIAKAEGWGLAWTSVPPEPGSGLELRLVEDAPIEGTIADQAGHPLAGVRVRPLRLSASEDGRLDAFLRVVRESPLFLDERRNLSKVLVAPTTVLPSATTDARGRFRMEGMGRERLLSLEVEGPDVERLTIHVATRPDVDLRNAGRRSHQDRHLSDGGAVLPVLYGSRFHHLALASMPVTGIVRDCASGLPVPNALVLGATEGRESYARAKTDQQGRFLLSGLPVDSKVRLTVLPGKDQPYLKEQRTVTTTGVGTPGTVADLELTRGVVMRGRLFEAGTGRPVRGTVKYLSFADNAFAARLPLIQLADERVSTDAEGRFLLIGLPGPGILSARADEDRFCMSHPEQFGRPADPQGLFGTLQGGFLGCDQFHAVVKVDVPEGGEVDCGIPLEPGISLRGKLVDAQNSPVVGATANRLTALGVAEILSTSEFVVTGLERGRPRLVWFVLAKKNMGRALLLPPEDGSGIESVTLQPCGAVIGRVVDAKGRPQLDALVGCSVDVEPSGLVHQRVRTDSDGRFRVTGLLPEMRYKLVLPERASPLGEVTVHPGETINVGDIVVGAGPGR